MKFTILKAIHNLCGTLTPTYLAVTDSEIYNFESNSQHSGVTNETAYSCHRQWNLQFWKQFTTHKLLYSSGLVLSPTVKFTILKAIHNVLVSIATTRKAVTDSEIYNFESNSQRIFKNTKKVGCCHRQWNLQFWKQFTTGGISAILPDMLSPTVKFTILKAIHNRCPCCRNRRLAVTDSEIYNFESNSQRTKRAIWKW